MTCSLTGPPAPESGSCCELWGRSEPLLSKLEKIIWTEVQVGGTWPLQSTAELWSPPFPSRTENMILWKMDAHLQLLHLASLCCTKARAIQWAKGQGSNSLLYFSPPSLINQCTRGVNLWLCSICKPSQSSGLVGWSREDKVLISGTCEAILSREFICLQDQTAAASGALEIITLCWPVAGE